MADAFSNHFPNDEAASLSYRDLGGHVKAAYFLFENAPGNVIDVTDRAWLTALPPSARIIGGFIFVTDSFGAGATACTLRRETGDTNLFTGSVTINLSSSGTLFPFDRPSRAVGAVMSDKPVNVKGERIGLALNAAGAPGAGRCTGLIYYV